MKKIKISFYISVLLLLLSMCGFSQTNCFDYIRNYSEYLTQISNKIIDKNIQIEYTITNWLDGSFTKTSDKISIIAGENAMVFKSDEVNIFQDSLASFMILNSQNTIVITNSINNKDISKQILNLSVLRDSLLKDCDIVECYDTLCNNTKQKYIKLKFEKDIAKALNIKSQQLFFAIDNNLLTKVIVNYNRGCEYSRTQIDFNKLEIVSNKLKKYSAKSKIFETNGQLKKEYKGFRVIDRR